jgi:hypothetical protein
MWTIYDHPIDYPGTFVARKFVIDGEKVTVTNEIIIALTLESVRDMLPPGLYRLNRLEDDDPKIVEVWV